MAAGISDHFTNGSNGTRPTPTTLTAIRAIGASSISVGALTGWPTATAVHFIIYTTDTSNKKVAGSQIDCKGIVSGTTITNIVYKAGNDAGNAIGAIVEAAPTAAWADDVVAGITAHANQDGSLIPAAVQTALGQGAASGAGWTTLGVAPATVTALGNRSYQLVINGSDQTGVLSPGMRLRTTRTVAAPTQSTSLNGTTQFYSKSSPAGMTFTDDFAVRGWLKMTSYAGGAIESRFNGTSGWLFFVTSSGQLTLRGHNGGIGNYSDVSSVQSLPLNKWVYVNAQLDMSTFTATTTTSYIMIDGVDVPAAVSRAGTNPTALIQAGNLEIGSYNGGTLPFPGKLSQVGVYSAKVTQATLLAAMSQTITGTETSLISAYSFNNTINDLNANANNLTANGSAVATNADSPFGGQAGGLISSTLDYGIVTAISFSTNTTLTVQVPEGCTIPTTGGVTTLSYSALKTPYGFPGQRTKWYVEFIAQATSGALGPTINVWTQLIGYQINVPIGEWLASTNMTMAAQSGGTSISMFTTLATVNNNFTNLDFTTHDFATLTSGFINTTIYRQAPISLAAATIHYFNIMQDGTTTTISATGQGTNAIRFENAYL